LAFDEHLFWCVVVWPMRGVILSLGLIHRFTPASSLVRSCISF
jgi:hypothetical protein